MKTVKTITTAKDVLSLIDFFCAKHPERKYELCCEDEVKLIQSSPLEAPKWIAPIRFFDPDVSRENQIRYFVFDHEFCTLHIQQDDPNNIIACPLKENKYDTYSSSPFHHWVVGKKHDDSSKM